MTNLELFRKDFPDRQIQVVNHDEFWKRHFNTSSTMSYSWRWKPIMFLEAEDGSYIVEDDIMREEASNE